MWSAWVDEPGGAGVERRGIGARWEALGPDGPIHTRVVDLEPGRRVVLELAEPAGESLVELLVEARDGGTAVTVWHRGAAPTRHPGLRRRWETSLARVAPPPRRWPTWAAAALLALVTIGVGWWSAPDPAPPEEPAPPAEPAPEEPAPPVVAAQPPAEAPYADARHVTGVIELARSEAGPVSGPRWCGDLVCYRVGLSTAAVTADGRPAEVPAGPLPSRDVDVVGSTVARVAFTTSWNQVVAGVQHVAADGRVTWVSTHPDADHPRLRADRRSVVFAAGPPGAQELYEGVVGGGLSVLVHAAGDQARPEPLPSGGVAYFERLAGQRWDVAWARGGERVVLAEGVHLPAEAGPAVSRSGREVAWVVDAPDGDRVVIHDLETGEERAWRFGFGVDDLTFGPRDELVFTAPPPDAPGHRRLWLVRDL